MCKNVKSFTIESLLADFEKAKQKSKLTCQGNKLGTAKGDRLDVLATLVDAYERQHHPIDPPDAIDAIRFRMEQQNLTRKELDFLIRSRGRIAEVLARKRALSIEMIRRLHTELEIPAEILIRPPVKGRRSRKPTSAMS
jgi:HTH-type transcriptional regulator/antitoxin HigA